MMESQHKVTGSELTNTVSYVLHEAALDAPVGQGWNLYSKAACDILAEKVVAVMLDDPYAADREYNITVAE